MKRALLCFVFIYGSAAFAQTTAVTATITDANSSPYANGTYQAFLVDLSGKPLSGATLSASGNPVVPTSVNGTLDSAGSFSILLPPNASITPASQWNFQICSSAPTMAVPLQVKAQSCFSSAQTISGSTQSLSASLSTLAPTLYYFNPVTGKCYSVTGSCGGGSGSGNVIAAPQFTITHYPTAGTVATVGGATGITDDGSGHLSAAGFIGTNSSVNGFLNLTSAGTLPTAPGTGTIQLVAPNTVTTPYALAPPGAPPTTSGSTYLSCTVANPTICSWAAAGGGATPSPQYQLPFYSASGTAATLTGSSAIFTNSAGLLGVTLNATALPAAQTGSMVQIGNADGVASNYEADSFGAIPGFTGVRWDGTNASPTGVVAGNVLTFFGGSGYDGTGYGSFTAGLRIVAADTWSTSDHGTYLSLSITPPGTTALAEVLRVYPDGGSSFASTTLGDPGPNNVAAFGFYGTQATASYSTTVSHAYMQENVGGALPLASSYSSTNACYYCVQFKNNLTAAVVGAAVNTSATSGNSLQGGFFAAASNDTGADSVGVSGYGFATGASAVTYGANPVAQGSVGLSFVTLVGLEADVQPYDPYTGYTDLVGFHIRIFNAESNNTTNNAYSGWLMQFSAGSQTNTVFAPIQNGMEWFTGILNSNGYSQILQPVAVLPSVAATTNAGPPPMEQDQYNWTNGTSLTTGSAWLRTVNLSGSSNPNIYYQLGLNTTTSVPSGSFAAFQLGNSNSGVAMEWVNSAGQVIARDGTTYANTLLLSQTIQGAGGAAPPALTAHPILEGANNSGNTEFDAVSYNGLATFASVYVGGTPGSPTAAGSGVNIGGQLSYAYNGTGLNGPLAGIIATTSQAQTTSNGGTQLGVYTTPNGSVTEALVATWGNDGGYYAAGATGGDQGAGTGNFTGLYVNGVAVGGASFPSGTTNQMLYYAASGTTVSVLTLGTNLSITSGVLNASSTAATAWSAITAGANTQTGAFSTTAPWTFSVAGAASTPADLFSGAPFAGTASTSYPLVFLSNGTAPTNFSTSGTYLGINGSSGFAGNLAEMWTNGTAEFIFTAAGALNTTGTVTALAFTGSSSSGSSILLNNTNTATSSACDNAGAITLRGSYWNGTAGAQNNVSLVQTCATGTNGGFTETIANTSGSTGQFTFAVTGNLNATGSANLSTPQTTVSCSVSGSAVFSEPLQGASEKKVIVYMAACVGTASYTYPTAFTNSPSIYASNNVAASIVTSVSTTAVTVTGATTTGSLFLGDY